jgi:hypothetical protein
MIVPSDPEYQLARMLKTRRAEIPSPFKELATWIETEFDADVLNVTFDRIIPNNRPRLSVVFERTATERRFCTGEMRDFDAAKQNAIRNRFAELTVETRFSIPDIRELLVIFQSFERVARIEANEAIPDSRIIELRASLNDPSIWEITRCFETATFFFFTDAQVAKLTQDLRSKYASKYNELARQFDEYGYIALEQIVVQFDSKENLDKNYGGSWFNYYR